MLTRMPFELKNAPETFDMLRAVIHASSRLQLALVNLDDVAVFFRPLVDPDEEVRRVSRILYGADVTIKLRKRRFFAKKSDYLGHIIQPFHLELVVRAADNVAKLESPTKVTELRSFLGLCNVFRWFLPNLTLLTGPLNKF